MKLFDKILIANRGEIAVRIIRAVKELGIKAVAIYAKADEEALHVLMADEAWCLGSNDLAETYLNIDKIIEIARASGSGAIHPGYGFLAENPAFVTACDKAGIVFIGPNAHAMKLMGNKIESREALKDKGIPMTAGITGDTKTLLKRAKEIPFPILIKAAAGGGGKGMRIVNDESQLAEILESTSREAKSYFSDGTVFIEKYIEEPRHIEIQVLGDNYGNVIHLFERECSIQRRHQKIIEESPSPTLDDKLRRKMGETAVKIAKEIGYNNAGTVEFLVDKNLNFYFLEMNARVQVEHPVTEMVTGIDIVQEQIYIAAGRKLSITQESVRQHGHAIECRIYAEDPENSFLPSPGRMTLYHEPEGDGIRVDSGIDHAVTIESFFDPIICKLITWGEDRDQAREKMTTSLNRFIIHGIRTNIAYLAQVMQHPAYISNAVSTKFCEEHGSEVIAAIHSGKEKIARHLPIIGYFLSEFSCPELCDCVEFVPVWHQVGYWRDIMELSGMIDGKDFSFSVVAGHDGAYLFRLGGHAYTAASKYFDEGRLETLIDGKPYYFHISNDDEGNGHISFEGFTFHIIRYDRLASNMEILGSLGKGHSKGDGKIVSPMPGKVIKVNVKEGDEVKRGVTLLIVEAMKMENYIAAPHDGIVEKVNVAAGDKVSGSTRLIELKIVN